MQCKSLMDHDTLVYMNVKWLSACRSDRWSPRPGNTLACQKPPHGLAWQDYWHGAGDLQRANLTLLSLPAVSSLRPAWHSPSAHPHGLTCSPDTHPRSACPAPPCQAAAQSTPCPLLLQRPWCKAAAAAAAANAARSPLEPSKPTDTTKEGSKVNFSISAAETPSLWGGSVPAEEFGHNRSKSWCFQLPPVTCWHLSVLPCIKIGTHSVNFFKIMGNFPQKLSFNWLVSWTK
jgi:hypothetical protein